MAVRCSPRPWRRYAALGDSFTEGMMDDLRPDGRHRGWADDVAAVLAQHAIDRGEPGLQYANLAIRGRLVHQVVAEQVPAALDLGPDLVTLAAGVNDSIRLHYDVDRVASDLERGVRALRAAGVDVVLFAFGDPSRRSPLMSPVRERIRRFNSAVQAIADHHDCYLVSFWQLAVFDDDHLWAPDRLHLAPAGHRLVARSVLAGLGLAGADPAERDWLTPAVPGPRPSVATRARGNLRWGRAYLLPWVARRMRGRSSGDDVVPKHPDWVPVPSSPPVGSVHSPN